MRFVNVIHKGPQINVESRKKAQAGASTKRGHAPHTVITSVNKTNNNELHT